jgi:hypothetical protein
METQSITAIFDHLADAESAVGRLEVAGIPVSDITIHRPSQADAGIPLTDRTVVTACVETRLIGKAMGILNGDGHLDGLIAIE